MNKFIQRLMVILVVIFSPALSYASVSQTFPSDMDYCFRQGSVVGVSNQVTLNYNHPTEEADLYKDGHIFVVYRLQSNPNLVWIFDHTKQWFQYDLNNIQGISHASYSGVLQPLLPFNIIENPLNLNDHIDDGELFVGYGLKVNSNSSISQSFQEMLDHNRYHKIWTVGNNVPQSKVNTICLTTDKMTIYAGSDSDNPL